MTKSEQKKNLTKDSLSNIQLILILTRRIPRSWVRKMEGLMRFFKEKWRALCWLGSLLLVFPATLTPFYFLSRALYEEGTKLLINTEMLYGFIISLIGFLIWAAVYPRVKKWAKE